MFSPNNDAKNEVFKCNSTNVSDFSMSMYSRWANHVTTINNLEEGWDGKENGNIIQEVTYIYVVKFTDVFHENHSLRGKVSIIK